MSAEPAPAETPSRDINCRGLRVLSLICAMWLMQNDSPWWGVLVLWVAMELIMDPNKP